jgi:N-acetylglucosaminyl-diphospho-decaprenol L-rhamnosyltransferase
MKISIIINHHQTLEILQLCLKSLLKNLPENIKKEIIVTDSETQEETEEIMREFFPQIIFITAKKNIGFGKSVNRALKKAEGEYILIINADIVINRKETIEKMIGYLKNNPEIGIIGPKLLNINNTRQISCFRFYTPAVIACRRTFLGKTKWGKKVLSHFLMDDIFNSKTPVETEIQRNQLNLGFSNFSISVDWLMGSALLARREAIEKVGYFDERFFMYLEDTDWCRRFWEAGYKVVYYPQAQMYHYHIQASKKKGGIFDLFFSKYTRIHLSSAIKYFLKWGFKKKKFY